MAPPTSPGKGFALATLSWLSPIRRPRLWETLIGAILRPYEAGTPKSETHLMSPNYRSLNEAATILCTYRGLVVTPYIRLGRSISASQKNPATTRLTFDHQPPTGASCRKRTWK